MPSSSHDMGRTSNVFQHVTRGWRWWSGSVTSPPFSFCWKGMMGFLPVVQKKKEKKKKVTYQFEKMKKQKLPYCSVKWWCSLALPDAHFDSTCRLKCLSRALWGAPLPTVRKEISAAWAMQCIVFTHRPEKLFWQTITSTWNDKRGEQSQFGLWLGGSETPDDRIG